MSKIKKTKQVLPTPTELKRYKEFAETCTRIAESPAWLSKEKAMYMSIASALYKADCMLMKIRRL